MSGRRVFAIFFVTIGLLVLAYVGLIVGIEWRVVTQGGTETDIVVKNITIGTLIGVGFIVVGLLPQLIVFPAMVFFGLLGLLVSDPPRRRTPRRRRTWLSPPPPMTETERYWHTGARFHVSAIREMFDGPDSPGS